jgi:hypothetical protein
LDNVQKEIDDQSYEEVYRNFGNTSLFVKSIPGFQNSFQKRWKINGILPYNSETAFITLSNQKNRNWDKYQTFYKEIEVLKGELESINQFNL